MIIFIFTPEDYHHASKYIFNSNHHNFIKFDSTQTWLCRCFFFDYIVNVHEAVLLYKLRFI